MEHLMSPSPSSGAAVSLQNRPPHRNIIKVCVRADTPKYYHILQQAPSSAGSCDVPFAGMLLYRSEGSLPHHSQMPLYMGAPRQAARAYRAEFASRVARHRDGTVSESRQWSRGHLAYALGCTAAEVYLASSCMVKDVDASFREFMTAGACTAAHRGMTDQLEAVQEVRYNPGVHYLCHGVQTILWAMGLLHLKMQQRDPLQAQGPGNPVTRIQR